MMTGGAAGQIVVVLATSADESRRKYNMIVEVDLVCCDVKQ